MTGYRIKTILMTAALMLGVASCGGGSTQVAGGGIGGTGISQGPITGFGSIFVNGVEFNTNTATITKDGTSATQSDLRVGMIVTVNGDIANSTSGTAATVTYAKELQGPINTITLPSTLSVLGQTVIVDNLTKIEVAGVSTATINDLKQNDTVEISGFPTVSGLRATYIEVKSPSSDVELKGLITATSGTTITVGGQIIDLTGITPSFTPAIGDYVEVKGTLNGSTLAATSLELKTNNLGSGSKDKAELQGVVSEVGTSTFVINGQQIQFDSTTNFNGGAAADIKTGLWLEVEGALSNGILVAAQVTFEDDLSLEGNVTATTTSSITLDTYPGLGIEIDSTLTDGYLDPAGIAVGSHAKVRGRKLDPSCTSNCPLLAIELEVTTASGSVNTELQGPVEAVDTANSTITILGQQMNLSSIPSFSGVGITDATSFFATVKPGDLVDITGTETNGVITWDAVELDN